MNNLSDVAPNRDSLSPRGAYLLANGSFENIIPLLITSVTFTVRVPHGPTLSAKCCAGKVSKT